MEADVPLGAQDLVGLLKGLPLALCLATSVISRYRCSVREYLKMWNNCSQASEIMGTDETLYRSLELSLEELEKADPVAAKILTLFSFLHHGDLWYDLCYNATDDTYPTWLQNLGNEKKSFRHYYPLLADLSFIELRITTKGSRFWETHPAIQVVARQRAKASEQEYIRCAVSLVASEVPRSFEANSWETIRRLGPHARLCWDYVKQGAWGPDTNLTDLESLGHVFRHIGHYSEASLSYRMIEHGLGFLPSTRDNNEFLANVLTNLGLVYTRQRKFNLALGAFDRSQRLMIELDILTPIVSMSIMYNKAVVFMMTERLNEAESLLQNAVVLVSENTINGHTWKRSEWNVLHLRILNDMGEVSLRKGAGEAALEFFRDVYNSQRAWHDELHPNLYSIKLNMGRALTKLGRFSEARALLFEVIAIYTEWWGRHHPETMRAIDELAWTFMEESKEKQATNETGGAEIQKAEELWTEALNFYRSTDGDESDMVTRIEANLRYLYS